VELLDRDGKVIEPYTAENCVPVSRDCTLMQVQWKHAPDLVELAGQPVRFRFSLTNGSLYAFWLSSDRSGRSEGFVAAGGPGYSGTRDTVGRRALLHPN
jgi:hypothetical protein